MDSNPRTPDVIRGESILQGTRVPLPNGMRVVRHTAPREVPVAGEVPLIHPKDPDSKQVQEFYTPEVAVFDLENPDHLDAYRKVWQEIAEGRSVLSENRVDFSEKTGKYKAFMRWSALDYALPGAPRPPRRFAPPQVSPEQ